jgi:pyruvate dehydrogenase E1 component beta subunit
LAIVQDATGPFSVGSEVAAIVASEGFDLLKGPVVRLAPPFAPIPFPPWLEGAYYPDASGVEDAVKNLLTVGQSGAATKI